MIDFEEHAIQRMVDDGCPNIDGLDEPSVDGPTGKAKPQPPLVAPIRNIFRLRTAP